MTAAARKRPQTAIAPAAVLVAADRGAGMVFVRFENEIDIALEPDSARTLARALDSAAAEAEAAPGGLIPV